MTRPRHWAVVGIDLAWGERRPDGLCLLAGTRGQVAHVAHGLTHGDKELLAWLQRNLPDEVPALLCLDAPVVCPNRTGSRPVDRLTHRLFHREQAGAHPANRGRCVRPLRVAGQLKRAGFSIATDWPRTARALIEVYPHPATVRWFGLDRTLKYKRGPVASRRRAFAQLQRMVRAWLEQNAPEILRHPPTADLLRARWTKNIEDMTDALLCAMIGWQWAAQGGGALEILGDVRRGFIAVPRA
jgi:predicted RNase H-like nuclease